MLRLLSLCTILSLLYISFVLIEQWDSRVLITVYEDYFIETTIFIVLVLIVIVISCILVALKVISLCFEIPYLLNKRCGISSSQKTIAMLMQSITFLISNNKHNATLIAKKLSSRIKPESRELYTIISAETEKDFEKQVEYFKELISSRYYNYFALKRLAQVFHQNELYTQAEKYASDALNVLEFDSDVLEILIDCYAYLNLWHKFITIVTKLNRVNPTKFTAIATKIASHYLAATKYALGLGKDSESVHYLESALELYPTYLEALELYFTINSSLHRTANQFVILQAAFIAQPSFALAEIYIKFSNMPAKTVYEELSKQIDHMQYGYLLVAIATYLNLPEQVKSLNFAPPSV